MFRISKFHVSVIAALMLSGCGDGSDSDESELANRGEYHYASQTGYYFPEDTRQLSPRNQSCIGETQYFESANERIRVYGSPRYSGSTFERAAFEVERNLAGALAYFDLTWNEFVSLRPFITDDPDAILLCIDSATPTTSFVEAALTGIAFPGYYQNWPNDYDRAIEFELIRFIQLNLVGETARNAVPAWFSDGQAHLMSGGDAVEPHQHYVGNPVKSVRSLSQEPNAIEHSALAYQYLAQANSESQVMAVMIDSSVLIGAGTDPDNAFEMAFDRAGLIDHQGAMLTLGRYMADYHNLMANSH